MADHREALLPLPTTPLEEELIDEDVVDELLDEDDVVEDDEDFAADDESAAAPTGVYQRKVPDVIRSYIEFFFKQVLDGNQGKIHEAYELHNKLTERYFLKSPWPEAERVAPIVNNDEFFVLLYKELYYRHIYSKLTPNIHQRIASWNNYRSLFDYLWEPNEPRAVSLPHQWLWDMIDEFIYQFQTFCHYRTKLTNKSDEEIAILSANPDAWHPAAMARYLTKFVKKSDIVAQELDKSKRTESSFGQLPLYRTMGYYAIIGLLRLHCLYGDYYSALKVLDPIDLSKKGGMFSRVTACHITLFYYTGFAYLMTRRYADAIRTFSIMLSYLNRMDSHRVQNDQIVKKKSEQMYGLLAIVIALCPQHLEDSLQQGIREKLGERFQRMQRGDESAFSEVFSKSCPKFVIPGAPKYDGERVNRHQEALELQRKLFLIEVRKQIVLPTIRSYLKLYTTIPITKLAKFLEVDVEILRAHLFMFKHKTRSLLWEGGSATEGTLVSSSDIDFYIDNDMIHIADTRVTKSYGDYFVNYINKFENILHVLDGDARPRRQPRS